MVDGMKAFFSKYKRYIIVSVVIYFALTIALIISSSGDLVPFVYQVF